MKNLLRFFSIAVFFAFLLTLNVSSDAIKFKVYGRWCGPDYGHNGPPIDPVDAVCKAHDLCCERSGRAMNNTLQYCGCDRIIISRMRDAIRATKSKKGKAAGLSILGTFIAAPCWCWKKICVPHISCHKVRKCQTIRKKVCYPTFHKVRSCKRIDVGWVHKTVCTWSVHKKTKCVWRKHRFCYTRPSCTKKVTCSKKKALGRGGRCLNQYIPVK